MRASRRYRQPGARVVALALLGLFFLGLPSARASMAVLLEEPYGDLGTVDPAGHVAIYLDHVCAATPVSLRACRPGELGVVISRYDGIGHIDWMAMPLIPYLYAVDAAEDIPVAVRKADIVRLRDTYRRAHLEAFAPDLPDGKMPPGNWYELAGAAFDRSIYGFEVDTTAEQDAKLIALFNDHKNKDDYNGAFRNCADFARSIVDFYYPHAVRRNFIADFGLTSPKQVARGLSHYAAKHPGIELQAFVISQISGEAPRSYPAQGLAEGIIKRFGIPLLVVSPAATAAVAAAYVTHGRFAEPKNAPVLNLRVGLVMEGAVNLNSSPAALAAADIVTASAKPVYPGGGAHVSEAVATFSTMQPKQTVAAEGTLISSTYVTGSPE